MVSVNKSFYNFVIALAGPYGAGCTTLSKELERVIKDWPGCHPFVIKVSSDIIDSFYPTITREAYTPSSLASAEKRSQQQKAGTTIRKIDPQLIGKLISAKIYELGDSFESSEEAKNVKTLIFIVDSLKNTNDYRLLKNIYRDEMFLLFVHANAEHRFNRMTQYQSWPKDKRSTFSVLDEIDSNEKLHNPSVGNAGQEVKDLSTFADYFIVNNHNNLEKLQCQGKRLLNLILGNGYNQPTFHEKSMHIAFSASNRSYCLSRQVGAVIVDSSGDILGIGHNDVPKAGGGLYTLEDSPNDKRCYAVGDRRCTNDLEKDSRFNKLLDELKKIIGEEEFTAKAVDVRKAITGSDFKSLTEYCRAVHAEMEAILCACRASGRSCVNASMYVTTQPCDNCVKHILCAGINRVYFIAPYPKSLATHLHGDSIVLDPTTDQPTTNKLAIFPYEGVAPIRFHDFFTQIDERKDSRGFAKIQQIEENAANPRFRFRVKPRSRLDGAEPDPLIYAELENSAEMYNLFKSITDGEGFYGKAGEEVRH